MTSRPVNTRRMATIALGALPFVAISASPAIAAPGAHGPNGEHLDGPATTASGTAQSPRFEAKSEGYEIVGRLGGGELSMFVNRYETNEPVLNAKVEVESGTLKAVAPFHDDMGDYAVADEALLKALATPGEHPLVITIVTGNEADLLEATLVVKPDAAAGAHAAHDDHGHGIADRLARPAAVVGVAALVAAGGWWFARRRALRAKNLGGAL